MSSRLAAVVVMVVLAVPLAAPAFSATYQTYEFSGTITRADQGAGSPYLDLVPGMPYTGHLLYEPSAPVAIDLGSSVIYNSWSRTPPPWLVDIAVDSRRFTANLLSYTVPAASAERIGLWAPMGLLEFDASLYGLRGAAVAGNLPPDLEAWALSPWRLTGEVTADRSWILAGEVSAFQESAPDDGEPPAPVPEPGTLLLLSSALAGLGVLRWRRGKG